MEMGMGMDGGGSIKFDERFVHVYEHSVRFGWHNVRICERAIAKRSEIPYWSGIHGVGMWIRIRIST